MGMPAAVFYSSLKGPKFVCREIFSELLGHLAERNTSFKIGLLILESRMAVARGSRRRERGVDVQ